MHILYLSSPGGGLETNVRVLAPALIQEGHCVSIIYLQDTFEAKKRRPVVGDIPIYHVTVGDWHYYLARATRGGLGLPRLVRSWEAAVAVERAMQDIHKHHPIDLIEVPEVIFLTRRLPAPFVMRLHSPAWLWRMMCDEPTTYVDGIEKRLEGLTLRFAVGITAPSAEVAEAIRGACGLDNRPIHIVPYPVDTNQFCPAPKDPACQYVLFVGRIEKRKGADILLRVIPRILVSYPECEFLFIGSPNPDLRELVDTAPPQVRFIDFMPRSELVPLYQQATVVVVPSLWDNSPNVIYEAMACGRPVIATRVGGIPELVEPGITGLLVPPGDDHQLANAISSLLGDAERRQSMGQQAREKVVASFELKHILHQTIALYERAVKN